MFSRDTTTTAHTNNRKKNDQQHKQHQDIAHTLWLAVSKNANDGRFTFEERSRFTDVMEEHRNKIRNCQLENASVTCYPRIVSFVGQTGVGKSSIIKVLIRHLWELEPTTVNTAVPVVGESRSSRPTSSDVHLYYSPLDTEAKPKRPLFFIDSEGFGSTVESVAAESRLRALGRKTQSEPAKETDTATLGTASRALKSVMDAGKRALEWISPDVNRSAAVEELFPRLIYNISDVVVYVVPQANMRSISAVLEKLLDWSKNARMSSINSPSLPSVIILINQCDPDENMEWNSEEKADSLFEDYDSGKDLSGLEDPKPGIKDVLTSSFNTVRFLGLPNARYGNTSLLVSQSQRLHTMLDTLTRQTFERKKRCNMVLALESLGKLYRFTFDHFSKSTPAPFNFLGAFLTVNPPPPGFTGSLLSILLEAEEATKRTRQNSDNTRFTNELHGVVPLISSIVAIDIRRRQVLGTVLEAWRSEIKSKSRLTPDETRGDSC